MSDVICQMPYTSDRIPYTIDTMPDARGQMQYTIGQRPYTIDKRSHTIGQVPCAIGHWTVRVREHMLVGSSHNVTSTLIYCSGTTRTRNGSSITPVRWARTNNCCSLSFSAAGDCTYAYMETR